MARRKATQHKVSPKLNTFLRNILENNTKRVIERDELKGFQEDYYEYIDENLHIRKFYPEELKEYYGDINVWKRPISRMCRNYFKSNGYVFLPLKDKNGKLAKQDWVLVEQMTVEETMEWTAYRRFLITLEPIRETLDLWVKKDETRKVFADQFYNWVVEEMHRVA